MIKIKKKFRKLSWKWVILIIHKTLLKKVVFNSFFQHRQSLCGSDEWRKTVPCLRSSVCEGPVAKRCCSRDDQIADCSWSPRFRSCSWIAEFRQIVWCTAVERLTILYVSRHNLNVTRCGTQSNCVPTGRAKKLNSCSLANPIADGRTHLRSYTSILIAMKWLYVGGKHDLKTMPDYGRMIVY